MTERHTDERYMTRTLTIFAIFLLGACASTATDNARLAESDVDIVWPGPPQQARIKYLYSFSEAGEIGIKAGIIKRFVRFIAGKERQGMARPYAVAVDEDLIAVADPGLGLVHLFKLKESKYAVIRDAGGDILESPIGVSLAPNAIYVADSVAGKIFVFDRKGEHIQTIAGLQRPTGIAFHPETRRLYATDTLASEIVIFNDVGARVSAFGVRGAAPGEFNFPTSLAFAGDSLLVNDTLNYRIQTFALDGTPVSSFGEVGDGSGQFALSKGLGVDGEGHIYVTDGLSNYVQIFNKQGHFLLSFGGMGGEPGQFRLPAGIFVFGNTIFVTDSQNGRLQVFEFLGGDVS